MLKPIGIALLPLFFSQFASASIDLNKTTQANTKVEQQATKHDENVRVIVTLNHDSVLKAKLAAKSTFPMQSAASKQKFLATTQQAIQHQQKTFLQQLNTNRVPYTVHRQLNYSGNYIVLTTQQKHLASLTALPSVKRVTIDQKVSKLLTSSTAQIGADRVWQLQDQRSRTVTGKEITVSVIDTGIDYTHPDLGGCYGSGCKVIGGIDFVNNDDDPIDDEGHGTHVAGIVAANGVVKGVAPDASLYAIKVLNEQGIGHSGDTLAAIEWSLNPDGNASTEDQVDIINLSLGSPTNPSEEMFETFALAEAAGTLIVVASGNHGGNEEVLRSPLNVYAKIESSLAVGAVDGNNELTDFSSWGPGDGAMKPDVVAPGLAIYSTKNGGGYEHLSGTSMAAPHVAGAAALLKQLFPHKTPSELKADLMSTAIDLSIERHKQGSGAIDVYQSTLAELTSSHGRLEFGWVNTEQATWQKKVSFELTNNTNSSQSLSLNISDDLPEGTTLQLSQSGLELDSNSSATVIATLTVDTSITPTLESTVPAYEGFIEVSGDSQLSMPFSFFHAPAFTIATSGFTSSQDWSYVYRVFKDGRHFDNSSSSGKGNMVQTYHLPPDTYDIVITWETDNRQKKLMQIFDDVTISSSKGYQIKFDEDELSGRVNFAFVDHLGAPLPSPVNNNTLSNNTLSHNGQITAFHKETGASLQNIIFNPNTTQELYLKINSDKFDVQGYVNYSSNDLKQNTWIPFNIEDTSAEQILLANEPSDYKEFNYQYGLLPNMDSFSLTYSRVIKANEYGTPYTTLEAITSSVEYVIPAPAGYRLHKALQRKTRNYRSFSDQEDMAQSPAINIAGDTIRYYDWQTGRYINSKPIDEVNVISVGNLVPYWGGQIVRRLHNEQTVYAVSYSAIGNNAMFNDSSLSLWNGGVEITCDTCDYNGSSVFNKFVFFDPIDYFNINAVGESNIKFDFSSAYLNTKPILATAELSFNTDNNDFSPPYLAGLDTLNNNILTPNLAPSPSSKIKLQVRDDVALKSVVAQIKSEQEQQWQDVELTVEDGNYIIAIEDSFDTGYYGIKLTATDSSDNQLIYTVTPAFSVGMCPDDQDCDGVIDSDDAFPLDPTEWLDTDNDGIGNNADTDDDGDGVEDEEDAFPLDSTESVDTDNDGIGNNADTDDDGDGVSDAEDAFPLDSTESVDTDNDGVGNNADTDDDGDGVSDAEDAFPLDSTESVDTDNDGVGNNADTDDDGDGVLDSNDAFPLDPTKSTASTPDTDSDTNSDSGSSGGSMSIYSLLLLLLVRSLTQHKLIRKHK